MCVHKGVPAADILRLSEGSNQAEGRVEVKMHNQWRTVCDKNWSLPDADVVCQQLGHPRAVRSLRSSYFSPSNG